MKLKRIIINAWIALSLTACAGGTGTGNPYTANAPNGLSTSPRSRAIQVGLCEVLVRCNSNLILSTCLYETSNLAGIESKLGVSSSPFLTFNQVISAEAQGRLAANTDSANQCEVEIKALSCSDPAVINAYQVANSSPFTEFSNAIPTGPNSCSEIF